ncbi:MAG TPA: TIGR03862 family flavoprotein [Rhizomicrobium sp.]|nr:TIGR03862 family flavoprotein [Rhizomicrobium sp.]
MADDVAQRTAAVIGGGPAGLMAAEILSAAGVAVTVYDRMPSVGRKFLMAGRGGLNLTHSEDFDHFVARYGVEADTLRPVLEAFPPAALTAWAEGLGQATFVGSSGRVFPKTMKASPLLRAWLVRLREQGVQFRVRHDWQGWSDDGALRFAAAGETVLVRPDVTVLALGGASWPKLGGDGAWTALLPSDAVAPLRPANAGFTVAWSEVFRDRFAGQPLKNAAFRFVRRARGEATITRYGIEGGAIYAISAALRQTIATHGLATLSIDLRPGITEDALTQNLQKPRGTESMTNYLRKALGLSPLEINLLREAFGVTLDPATLPHRIKHLPLTVTGIQPLERAISTAGGLRFDALDAHLMLRNWPGTFAAGEMLDWEAPTGGYLLQASFATGVAAAKGALAWLAAKDT